jgi:hypothetical protein
MDLEQMQTELRRLVALEAIRDVLYRYCQACDRCDAELLKTCYHLDGWDDHGIFSGPGHEFADWMCAKLAANPHGRHLVGNPLIELRGHRALAESRYLVSMRIAVDADAYIDRVTEGRYIDVFEERDGVWALLLRKIVKDGGAGDRITLVRGQGDGWGNEYSAPNVRPRREDPIYLGFDITSIVAAPMVNDDPWAHVRATAFEQAPAAPSPE